MRCTGVSQMAIIMIYFIRDESTQHIKIGFTAESGADRLRHLQTGCPGKLVLLLQIDGSSKNETEWHDRFAVARERGEWFRPVPELLQAIEEMLASREENAMRALQKLQMEQAEMGISGERGWSLEELEYLRIHDWIPPESKKRYKQ